MSHPISRTLAPLLALVIVTGCNSAEQPDQEPALESAAASAASSAPANIALPAMTDASAETIDQVFDCSAVTEIPLVECQALVAFYLATNGPNWIENGGWLATNTPCTWYGVSCADDRVESLAIFFNGLQGPLPATLADLGQLRLLDLHNNSIGGPIPAELGQLANLRYLEAKFM